jgi:hypothetical protein
VVPEEKDVDSDHYARKSYDVDADGQVSRHPPSLLRERGRPGRGCPPIRRSRAVPGQHFQFALPATRTVSNRSESFMRLARSLTSAPEVPG